MKKRFGVPFSGAADMEFEAPTLTSAIDMMVTGETSMGRDAGHSGMDRAGHDGYERMALTDRDGHMPMHRTLKQIRGA